MTNEQQDSCRTTAESDSQPAVGQGSRRKLGAWATAGSLGSAVLASACCWLPLVAVAFGASAVGVGAFFEQYRPWFLAVATVLLGIGFYFLYIRKEECAPGSACAVPSGKAQRFSRGMFWVSVLFISAFAFFPNYVGYFLGGSPSGVGASSENAISQDAVEVRLAIEGMTCEACAVGIQAELAKVQGVIAAEVRFDDKLAIVHLQRGADTEDAALLAAVETAGYRATRQAVATQEQH